MIKLLHEGLVTQNKNVSYFSILKTIPNISIHIHIVFLNISAKGVRLTSGVHYAIAMTHFSKFNKIFPNKSKSFLNSSAHFQGIFMESVSTCIVLRTPRNGTFLNIYKNISMKCVLTFPRKTSKNTLDFLKWSILNFDYSGLER